MICIGTLQYITYNNDAIFVIKIRIFLDEHINVQQHGKIEILEPHKTNSKYISINMNRHVVTLTFAENADSYGRFMR